MPPEAHFDVTTLNNSKVIVDQETIRRSNPQRFEMEHLDGILYHDVDAQLMVGYKDVRADEFWVRGHIPGMPLMPGVIMLEAAAQLCAYFAATLGVIGPESMLGFGGLEEVRFRGAVRPGDRLILVAKGERLKPRHSVFNCQGFVNGAMVFHGKIIGVPLQVQPEG